MKKTLITLLALSGLAMGSSESAGSVLPTTVPTHKSTTSTDWVEMKWGNISAANLKTNFNLLGITDVGNYSFLRNGKDDHESNLCITMEGTSLRMHGRPGGAATDVFYVNVVTLDSIIGDTELQDGQTLTFSTTYASSDPSDNWFGWYYQSPEGDLTEITSVKVNELPDGTAGTKSWEMGADLVNSLDGDTKLFAVYRNAFTTNKEVTAYVYSSLDISDMRYTVIPPTPDDNVPEPTTATLSLLALAGLAARRRRK